MGDSSSSKLDEIKENEADANNALYQELCEVHKYWGVARGCKEEVQYCSARKTSDGPTTFFIPISSSNAKTSPAQLERLQDMFNSESIVLAIQGADSSSVYYEVSRGLVRNTSEKAKKEFPESFLRNNRKLLVTQAQARNQPEPEV